MSPAGPNENLYKHFFNQYCGEKSIIKKNNRLTYGLLSTAHMATRHNKAHEF